MIQTSEFLLYPQLQTAKFANCLIGRDSFRPPYWCFSIVTCRGQKQVQKGLRREIGTGNLTLDEFIGTRAKELRLLNGIRAEKVAIALSLTKESYTAFEMGQNNVRAVTMFDLATFYNLPVTYFLDGYENSAARNTQRKTSS